MNTFYSTHGGTGFGIASVAQFPSTPSRSHSMDSAIPRTSEEFTPRQRDRRMAFVELLAVLSRALTDGSDGSAMRSVFEESLRRMFPVRSIQLREGPNRWAARGEDAVGSESIAFDIPGTDAESAGVLEASFDPECRLGEWDFQMLGAAAHLAALVLEVDRARLRWPRPGFGLTMRRDGAAPLIGSTPAMQAMRSQIERVAITDFTILLEGESGVGKELVARQIHDLSRRRHGPFVAINCAALVETLLEPELFGIEDRTATGVRGRRGEFEAAGGGTLFPGEGSDLSLSAQAKLLRAIQDLVIERVGGHATRRVDIRIIAATNRSLSDMVDRTLFRPDLFYRLSGGDIRVPTLRARRTDVMELANYFLERHRSTCPLRLSVAAAHALISDGWPGNGRELERLLERAGTL